MSEPQTNQETVVHSPAQQPQEQEQESLTNANTPVELKGPVKTLKDAFPDLDIDIIETILASQGGNLDSAFEVLLGMSDPSYKPEPSSDQMRQDEEYARRLARESQRTQNTTPKNTNDQALLFNFQEELPIIKEKVIEAGAAAKNKIMNLYNQFMAGPNDSQNMSGSSNNNNRNNGDLLETRMGNLSLTESQPSPNNASADLYEWDGRVTQSKVKTSTPNDQLLSDEEFARRIAREEAELAAASVNRSSNTDNMGPIQRSEVEEATLSAVDTKQNKPVTSYTINDDDDDDLDDLFEKKAEEGQIGRAHV